MIGNLLRLTVAFFAVCLALAACSPGDKAGSAIRIGVISMLSGEQARSRGAEMGKAVRLAAQEANARGGIRVGLFRRTVSILEEDDRGTPEAAVDAARKLVFTDRVVALIGPQFSSNAIPVARLAEQERVPMVCPLSTHPDTTAGKRYVFRVPYLDTFQGAVLARFARDHLAARSAAVLYDVASAYNTTLARVFGETFSALGGVVVASETYTPDAAADFPVQLRRVAAALPDVLFLPNYAADVEVQAKQARSMGIASTFLGGDGWDGSAFAPMPQFEGSYYTTTWHPAVESPVSRTFLAAYQRAYGEQPTDVAATSYDAATLLLTAIERARSTEADAVRDALAGTHAFPGVTGSVSYRGGGDPAKSAMVVKIGSAQTAVYAVLDALEAGGPPR